MRHPATRLRARVPVVGLAVLAVTALLPSVAAEGRGDRYEWAALGDSYTAGLFVGDPRPPLGSSSRDGCDRTTGSYPDLVRRALAARPLDRPVNLTDVSCDNAAVGNVAWERQQPTSQVQPPDGDPARWPMVDPQIRRARLGDRTDVVTVGIGAISLPFGECLELSLAQRSCRQYYTNPPEGVEGIDAKLSRIRDEYGRMLDAIHHAAPHAEVITVGYPAILPERGSACGGGPTQVGPISPADIDWLRDDTLKALNKIIHREAATHGDRYVDLYTSSIGHDVCQPEDTQWIEGICGDAAPYWPTQPPGGLPFDCAAIGKRATLLHPNAREHINAAPLVERAVLDALVEG
ncbi:SGNH/GDSL hydrolase family protein [Streptomyces sp. BE20]|uniref:SGNH/GDSL hydrolase family protein n=1 Tax=unclassified Streptomyces TaxID=2593676 RepID=UPI002E774DCA|nr:MULTISPECIES: SGNH/GDSL hydrolase family protein [unclassified Streptomyces]MED7948818.1 SGNH/GDSL hydrolase family protein [Streptomyces sp. BE303]MEE1821307.1 SGNH/GDSL hydrolase family protein [Streptomyces sp. BE20]